MHNLQLPVLLIFRFFLKFKIFFFVKKKSIQTDATKIPRRGFAWWKIRRAMKRDGIKWFGFTLTGEVRSCLSLAARSRCRRLVVLGDRSSRCRCCRWPRREDVGLRRWCDRFERSGFFLCAAASKLQVEAKWLGVKTGGRRGHSANRVEVRQKRSIEEAKLTQRST